MKKTAIAGAFLLLALSLTSAHAASLPEGCRAGDSFSATTGHSCTEPQTACAPGDLYSSETGLPCSSAFLPGCGSTAGYSVLTGTKCDGSTVSQELISQLKQLIQNTMPKTTEQTVTVTPPVQQASQDSVLDIPAPLTEKQIAFNTLKEQEKALKAQYPNMYYVATMSMSNGKPGNVIQVSQTDPTIIGELWVDENDNSTIHLISK